MAIESFDYVIAGGGLAGLVLASRLSEDECVQVLVVEAGEDLTADPRVNVPGMWPTLLRGDTAWEFRTVPQAGLGGREIHFPQGRTLGGSSALNGLSFSGTSRANIDAWEALGNKGWGWSAFSESLTRSFTLFDSRGDRTRGEGPLHVTLPEEDSEWPRVWRETLSSLGFEADTDDPYGGEVRGSLVVADTIQPASRTRSFAGNAYLAPARSRPNLTVWTKTTVNRILFDTSSGSDSRDDTPTATGLLVTRAGEEGQSRVVKARKEVIVSAGSINTPRLLELSGVGDAERLRALGIEPIVHNAGVGENLQNHPLCTLSLEIIETPRFETVDKLARQDAAALAAATASYAQHKGPLAKGGANIYAQLPTPGTTDDGVADLVGLLKQEKQEKQAGRVGDTDPFTRAHDAYMASVLSSPTETTACYMAIPGFGAADPDGWMAGPPPGEESYFTLSILLAHPASRGSVHITSPCPDVLPAIDPRYLDHPLDVEILARHLQFAEKIAATEPLKCVIKPDGRRNPTAPPSFADLDVAKEYLRNTVAGAHHFTGTCSMMPRALGGVVDPQLRVYGARNLRICDASIIPLTPRTNPQATVYGVAEHAAKIIKSGSLR